MPFDRVLPIMFTVAIVPLLHLLLCSLVDETEANFYWVIISLFKSIQIKRFFKNLNMLWSYIYILRED